MFSTTHFAKIFGSYFTFTVLFDFIIVLLMINLNSEIWNFILRNLNQTPIDGLQLFGLLSSLLRAFINMKILMKLFG